MEDYPVWIRFSGCAVLVVGGGRVAARKIRILRSVGAEITVVSPKLTPSVKRLGDRGEIRWLRRRYRSGDLHGKRLAFACTDLSEINRRVAREADERGVWVNVATDPDDSTLTLPAVYRRGTIQVAVATGGRSPALAARLRDEIASTIDPAYEVWAALLGEIRRALKETDLSQPERATRLRALAASDLLDRIRGMGGRHIDPVDEKRILSRLRRLSGLPAFQPKGNWMKALREVGRSVRRKGRGGGR